MKIMKLKIYGLLMLCTASLYGMSDEENYIKHEDISVSRFQVQNCSLSVEKLPFQKNCDSLQNEELAELLDKQIDDIGIYFYDEDLFDILNHPDIVASVISLGGRVDYKDEPRIAMTAWIDIIVNPTVTNVFNIDLIARNVERRLMRLGIDGILTKVRSHNVDNE